MNNNFNMACRIIIDFPDLDLSLFIGLQDGIDQRSGGLAERKFGNDKGFLVEL